MKEFICDFEINDKLYDIYVVEKIEGKKTYIGETNYNTKKVFIENGNYNQMLLTLKHELLHIWLYEKGYKNQKDGCFTFEDICEICAYSNDFVNKVVKKYEFYMRLFETKRMYMGG